MNEGWAERRVRGPFSTPWVGLCALALALAASGCQEKKEVDPPTIPLPTATAPTPPAEPATATPDPPANPTPPTTATAAPPPNGQPAPARSGGAAPQNTGLPFLKGLPPPPVKLPQGLPKLPL